MILAHFNAHLLITSLLLPLTMILMFITYYFCLHTQSLSGHTSGIDSVSFDSSEVLVAAGAASGTIKLWDLEEAKSMLFLN